jgi:hypothetical protein
MAYFEEEILEEPIQVPPESLLFIVSNDWQPPSHNITRTRSPFSMEGATCIIEEEFQDEFLHLNSVASIQNTDNQVGIVVKAMEAVEAMDTFGMEVEGHLVLKVPPLMTLLYLRHAPPPLFHLEKLDHIFELRNQMVDQIHRDTIMH